MAAFLPYVYGYLGGCATVGAWWLWISRRTQIRAAEQAALNAAKKL